MALKPEEMEALPMAVPPYATRAPSTPPDLGDSIVDRETVQEVLSRVDRGEIDGLPPEWTKLEVLQSPELSAAFAERLKRSPLSSQWPLPHRVVALNLALRDMWTNLSKTDLSVDPGQVQDVETWAFNYLTGQFPDLPAEAITILASTLILTPREVNRFTGVSLSTLQLWRDQHSERGPRFTIRNRTVQYRYADVLAWMLNAVVL